MRATMTNTTTGIVVPLQNISSSASSTMGIFIRGNTSHAHNHVPPKQLSYFDSSGLFWDEISIASSYTTSVTVNRRAWIANLAIHPAGGTTGISTSNMYRGDGMVGSLPNKFDIFPYSSIDEISIRDGDVIVKLEAYADRILQFKRDKLHIFNVETLGEEFVEDTYNFKGILYKHNSCKTDFGIAWVNQHGCYLYDGEDVNNLLEHKKEEERLKKISAKFWSDFVGDLTNAQIAYEPNERQIIIGGTGGDYLYYDVPTQAWGDASNIFTDRAGATTSRTNFINDWDGNISWIDVDDSDVVTTKVYDVNERSKSPELNVLTADIDFGQPATRKKIHKVWISYKGYATNVIVKYGVNGETDTDDFYQFKNIGTGTTSDTPLEDKSVGEDAEIWNQAELAPATSSQANNIYSLRIFIGGSQDGSGVFTHSDFEINDITIVYRTKTVR